MERNGTERNGTIAYGSTNRITVFVGPLFGTKVFHVKRSRVNATLERSTFRNKATWNGTRLLPCEWGHRTALSMKNGRPPSKRNHTTKNGAPSQTVHWLQNAMVSKVITILLIVHPTANLVETLLGIEAAWKGTGHPTSQCR